MPIQFEAPESLEARIAVGASTRSASAWQRSSVAAPSGILRIDHSMRGRSGPTANSP
jgi:hypothetical protein